MSKNSERPPLTHASGTPVSLTSRRSSLRAQPRTGITGWMTITGSSRAIYSAK
jgi:hypothetical protein